MNRTNDDLSVWKRFFSPREEVHKHWYTPLDHFEFKSDEFYGAIEKQLTGRSVPGLEISRVDLSEGGLLSGKREYLRLKRERLVFDICAAPFGTSYFFSFRFVELPLGIKPSELVVFLVSLGFTFWVLMKLMGTLWGFLVLLTLLGVSAYIMRNALALGLKDLDANLLNTPVIGPIYEVVFRKETYFREDTRLMYLTTVNSITEALVDEITAAKGVKIVKRFERAPLHGDVYRERPHPPQGPEGPAAEAV